MDSLPRTNTVLLYEAWILWPQALDKSWEVVRGSAACGVGVRAAPYTEAGDIEAGCRVLLSLSLSQPHPHSDSHSSTWRPLFAAPADHTIPFGLGRNCGKCCYCYYPIWLRVLSRSKCVSSFPDAAFLYHFALYTWAHEIRQYGQGLRHTTKTTNFCSVQGPPFQNYQRLYHNYMYVYICIYSSICLFTCLCI